MADPNIKTIQLSGTAGAQAQVPEMGSGPTQEGGTRSKRQRKPKASKTYKVGVITKEGGGATSPGTIVQMSASQTPSLPGAPQPVGATSALTDKGSPTDCLKGGARHAPATAAAAAPAVKVVLAAPKKKKGKVILAAAKAAAPAAAAHPLKPTQTRKAARKVRVSMKSLSKKIHKAKTIRKAATDTTIEQVKKELQKAGLIKADSKAPDTILRQMYADFLTLKSRAL